ncbi:hypothetical protein K0M31_014884 [Melipona bicolor]|uniref:Uncharacterized protein n=1 Tax=Melipona bicolor TaxID=60889 RepID=A0AA40FGH4_9HYME|nr:hypothetical protein K0M31_014884 [Melipona bicolor]
MDTFIFRGVPGFKGERENKIEYLDKGQLEWEDQSPRWSKEFLDEFIAGCFSVSDWQMEGGREIKASQACTIRLDRKIVIARGVAGWGREGGKATRRRENWIIENAENPIARVN